MYSIHDEKHIIEMLEKHGHKKFRYTQIENAIYKNLITDFEVTSDDGQTTKFLFSTTDDKMIEAVIMRHRSGRNTLCVSSQAGCPMACSFCATGKL